LLLLGRKALEHLHQAAAAEGTRLRSSHAGEEPEEAKRKKPAGKRPERTSQ
jgi:hypothetical protein